MALSFLKKISTSAAIFKRLEFSFCYCVKWDNTKRFCHDSEKGAGLFTQQFEQNVVGLRRERKDLAVNFLERLHLERYSRKNKPTRLCNQLKQQRKLCWVWEAFRKSKVKLSAVGKTRWTLEGLKGTETLILEKWESLSFAVLRFVLFSEYQPQALCVYLGKT